MNRKLVFFCVGFTIQLLFTQLFCDVKYIGPITLAIIVAIGLCFAVRKFLKQGILLMLGASLALCWFSVYPRIFPIPEMSDDKVSFVAVAKDYSYENNKETGVVCKAEILSFDGKELKHTFTSRIYISDKTVSIKPGDRFRGEANFEIPKNDEYFNAFTYYKTRGIDAIAFSDEIRLLQTNENTWSLKYLPEYISYASKVRINQVSQGEAGGLIKALILGDKSDFSVENQENFTITGLAHVVAVSGMHIAFLAGFIILIVGRKRAIYIAMPILILFALVVGNPPSVMRALIMQLIVMVSVKIRREPDSITSIATALLIILFTNPYSILDTGLQLSFLATLGIVLYSTKLNAFFLKYISVRRKWLHNIISFFTSTFATSIVATIFTTPVIAIRFHTISIIGPLCNLFLIWMVTVIFIIAIVGLALSFLFFSIGKIVFVPAIWICNILLLATDFAAKIPFATIYLTDIYSTAFLIYFYVMMFVALGGREKRFAIPLACIMITLGVTICFASISRDEDYDGIRFSVLDVGQGASMIADDRESYVIVDCGGDRNTSAGYIARDHLRKIGADEIDTLILTHMHDDHVNGVKTLLERVDVRNLYISEYNRKEDECKSIVETAKRRGTQVHYVSKNTIIPMDYWQIRIYPTGWLPDDNEQGLVVLFRQGEFELIVTGDLEHASENLLCKHNTLPDVEAYIVGHHGSDTSSSLKFMNTILPEFAVISAGKDNYYGHPHENVLYLFEKMGIDVHRTDEEGTIVFYSDEITKGVS